MGLEVGLGLGLGQRPPSSLRALRDHGRRRGMTGDGGRWREMAGDDGGLREMAYLEAKPVSHVRIVAEASALCSDDDVGESWRGHGGVMEGSWNGHGKVLEGSWKGHGRVMEWSWKGHGMVMEWSWNGHGRVMDGSWTGHGRVMERSWTAHATYMCGFDGAWVVSHERQVGRDGRPEGSRLWRG